MSTARPRIHVTAERGWLNDPLGVTWRDGRYHVFFQHLPGSTEWAVGCHWGHASSPDLLTWTPHPVALTPDAREAGCWTGDVVAQPDGSGLAAYSSVLAPDLDRSVVRLARSTDPDWEHWGQGEVLVSPPADPSLRMFRDPALVPERAGIGWRMLVGAGYADGTAAVLSWTSEDLVRWEPAAPLLRRHSDREPGEVWTGHGWECPQLLRVGDRDLLVVSVWSATALHHVAAAVGTVEDGRMEVEGWHRLTYGEPQAGHYAAAAFTDADGEPCLLFWVRGVGAADEGWAGALSVPYRVTLRDGVPILRPHPQVLHGAAAAGVLSAPWEPAEGAVQRLVAPDGSTAALLEADGTAVRARVGDHDVRLPTRPGEPVHVLVDGAVLEVASGLAVTGLPIAPGAAPDPG